MFINEVNEDKCNLFRNKAAAVIKTWFILLSDKMLSNSWS